MASPSSSRENTSLAANVTEDLVTLLLQGTEVTKGLLQGYSERGQLDVADKHGRTPLMIACWMSIGYMGDFSPISLGYLFSEEPDPKCNNMEYLPVAEFLLTNGADPNSRAKDGKTPMHYACMNKDALPGDFLEQCDDDEEDDKDEVLNSKCSIIKLLFKHGALPIQENLDGWTAPYLASISIPPNSISLSLEREEICSDIKIKAAEILGVVQHFVGKSVGRWSHSSHYFMRAISFQRDGVLPERLGSSDLATHFGEVSLKECHTLNEFNSPKPYDVGFRSHAILVADRLLPEDLKQKFLYESVVALGTFLIDRPTAKMFEEGFHVFSFALGLEKQSKLKLGSVASHIPLIHDSDRNLQFCRSLIDTLKEYESIINFLPIDYLLKNSSLLLEAFSELMYFETWYHSNMDTLESIVKAIETSLRVLRGRILRETPEKYHHLPTLSFKITEKLQSAFSYYFEYPEDHKWSLIRLKFVILRLLLSENASYVDGSGRSVLHILAESIPFYESHYAHATYDTYMERRPLVYGDHSQWVNKDLRHIQDLAIAFVRHGCPTDAVSDFGSGWTAWEIMKMRCRYNHDIYPSLLASMRPTMSVLRLEELSARAVLRHGIDYRKFAPARLREVIEGGVLDLELMMSSA